MRYAQNADEKITKARKWGQAHGYYGMTGGWIYREGKDIPIRGPRHGVLSRTGHKPVCQGWAKLYDRKAATIESWLQMMETDPR